MTTRVTVALDDDVLRAARIAAARAGVRDSELVETALRSYLGLDVVTEIRATNDLDEEAAAAPVYEESHAARRTSSRWPAQPAGASSSPETPTCSGS